METDNQQLWVGVEMLEIVAIGDVAALENFLLKHPERSLLDITPCEKWNWLHKACNSLDANEPPREMVEYLIKQGIDINAQDCYLATPLHYALRSRNAEAAIALLEAGADPNAADCDGLRCLSMIGYVKNRLDVLELMFRNSANPNLLMGDGTGRTILESWKPDEYTTDAEDEAIYNMMKQHT